MLITNHLPPSFSSELCTPPRYRSREGEQPHEMSAPLMSTTRRAGGCTMYRTAMQAHVVANDPRTLPRIPRLTLLAHALRVDRTHRRRASEFPSQLQPSPVVTPSLSRPSTSEWKTGNGPHATRTSDVPAYSLLYIPRPRRPAVLGMCTSSSLVGNVRELTSRLKSLES